MSGAILVRWYSSPSGGPHKADSFDPLLSLRRPSSFFIWACPSHTHTIVSRSWRRPASGMSTKLSESSIAWISQTMSEGRFVASFVLMSSFVSLHSILLHAEGWGYPRINSGRPWKLRRRADLDQTSRHWLILALDYIILSTRNFFVQISRPLFF